MILYINYVNLLDEGTVLLPTYRGMHCLFISLNISDHSLR